MIRSFVLAAGLLLSLSACQKTSSPPSTSPGTNPASTTFINPLLTSGPDPWVYEKDGFYYYLATTGSDVNIRKTAKMSELNGSVSKLVWRPTNTANARDVWAPELHFLDGKWYIYVTAGPGNCCAGQRLWVLENPAADPTTGTWTEKGRIFNPNEDFWAIDGTVMDLGGKRYFLWSGHDNGTNETQRIYISEMSNPWTLVGPRVELSSPQYNWEKVGPIQINEGPQVLQHGGRTFIVYSASHCNSDGLCLGSADAEHRRQPPQPYRLEQVAHAGIPAESGAGAFGPGHNAFFKSKDGSEDWIIYHANNGAGQGCGNARNPRIQKFTWNADGTPNFGQPVPISVPQAKPAGE